MINSFLINNNTAEVLNQAIRRTNRDHTATKIVLRMVYITHTLNPSHTPAFNSQTHLSRASYT